MSRRSAFDDFFEEVQEFTDYTLVCHGDLPLQQVERMFLDDHHLALTADLRYANHYIRENIYRTWVKHHYGQNEDGEAQNMWWLHDEYKVKRRGARVVWALQPDWHYMKFGHMYHPQIGDDGKRLPTTVCMICGLLHPDWPEAAFKP